MILFYYIMLLLASHSAVLKWQKPNVGSVAFYNVYRNTRGCTAAFTKINSSGVTSLGYTDHNVTAGTRYAYKMTAVDTKGIESSYSTCVVVSIP